MDLLRGTLDMLILKTLEAGEQHGYAIARTIERATADVLRVEEGSLYPALHRIEERGWITSHWARSENRRRAKFYTLTDQGRAQLVRETAQWQEYAAAIAQAMGLPTSRSA